jgi:hypothetical protein
MSEEKTMRSLIYGPDAADVARIVASRALRVEVAMSEDLTGLAEADTPQALWDAFEDACYRRYDLMRATYTTSSLLSHYLP